MALFVAKTATALVTEALALLEVVDDQSAIPAADLERGSRQLGLMLKSIQAEGATLWMRRRLTVDLIEGEADYILDDNSVTALDAAQATIATDDEGEDEIPATFISRREYMDTPGKTETGRPVNIWFYRNDDGEPTITVWPTPDDDYYLFLDHREPFANITSSTATLEIPDYWIDATVYGLAKRCAILYGKAGTPRYTEISKIAKDLYDTAAAFDIVQDGDGEVRFAPGP